MRNRRREERSVFDTAGHLFSGGDAQRGAAGAAHASELRRQAVLVDAVMHRVASVVRDLPNDAALADWWGPARDRFLEAAERERAHLGRQIYRLDGVRIQLEHAALVAESASP